MSSVTNIFTGNKINTDQLTEIAPGVFVGPSLKTEAPRYGIVKYARQADGTLREVLKTWSSYEKITKTLPERLGLKLGVRVLRALVASGLVRGTRVTPFQTEIDLTDLARHRAESAKPGFWTPQRLSDYSIGWSETNYGTPDDDDTPVA